MKKATVLLLTAVLLLGLAACGETQPDPTEAPVETPASVQTEAPDPTEAPAEEDESLLETAKSFEGKPLEELIAAIETFLRSLSPADRDIFICRYWLFLPAAETASRLRLSKSRVNTGLFRTREKLADYLSREGFI